MKTLTLSTSPHIRQHQRTTRSFMLDVLVALTPVLVMAIIYFGYHVLINAVVCMGSCLGFELLFSLILKKDFSKQAVRESTCWDFSCLVTGLILALNLPSVIIVKGWDLNVYRQGAANAVNAVDYVAFSGDTIFLCIIGSLIAIVLVKLLFGGIGKNFVNPAATARVFIFLAVGLTAVNTTGLGGVLSASTGATWLSGNKLTNNQNMFLQMFLGNRGASAVGETCMIAIFIGYVYLCIRRVIDFRLPLIIMLSAALFALFFDGLPRHLVGARLVNNMYAHMMSGGLAFGAVFMATDYATSPNTFWGNVLYGVGISLFTMLIRVFGNYPEGLSFALLIMNVTVPLIDKYIVQKPFGYVKVPKAKPAKAIKGGEKA